MLQRIQTIWMILAVLAPVFLFLTGQDVQLVENSSTPIVTIICPILFFIGVLSIVSYKNRKRQLLLNNISMVINALLIGILVYWLLKLSGGIQLPEKGIELVFPTLAILSLLIANVCIRKDEKLVKSVDRLR